MCDIICRPFSNIDGDGFKILENGARDQEGGDMWRKGRRRTISTTKSMTQSKATRVVMGLFPLEIAYTRSVENTGSV